jgi:hypothetical protein
MAVYEERRVDLRATSFAAYLRLVREQVWPALAARGARPLVLLNGLIGAPATETYLYTGFPDLAAWQEAQPLLAGATPEDAESAPWAAGRQRLVETESTRLLLPSGPRPKSETPFEDRRAVYGQRRFWLRPVDWPAFIGHSAGGIWPRIEAQDARILGLFRDAATTDPLAALLLTGYHGPAHWQDTRATETPWRDVSGALADQDTRGRTARQAMTLRSYVCLMTAHWPD